MRNVALTSTVILLLTLPCAVQAQFTFITNNGAITITGYTGSDDMVTIPTTINGLPVASVGEYAFQDRSDLVSIAIPNSVTNIGNEAFEGCSALTTVSLGSGVLNIGFLAFANCFGLESILIPNSVMNISDSAFLQCVNLMDVSLGDGVMSIGHQAFVYCTSLTSIVVPNSVTNIGEDSFGFCYNLTNITVAADNPAYSGLNGVLFDKNQTTLVECPGGYTGSYIVPNGVMNIGNGAFSECFGLTSVAIPDGVLNIGFSAFYGCSSLTSIAIPDSVTNISGHAFETCAGLTNVSLGDGVINIDYWAFLDCSSLTSIVIPSSVMSIGDRAFQLCTSLTKVTFLANAPALSGGSWFFLDPAKVYYYYGTTGWGTTYGSRPTVMLGAPAPRIGDSGSLGVQSNQFSFTVAGVTNQTVVIETCTDLTQIDWLPIATNTLINGSSYFSDPQWTNYPSRFYRLRSQ